MSWKCDQVRTTSLKANSQVYTSATVSSLNTDEQRERERERRRERERKTRRPSQSKTCFMQEALDFAKATSLAWRLEW